MVGVVKSFFAVAKTCVCAFVCIAGGGSANYCVAQNAKTMRFLCVKSMGGFTGKRKLSSFVFVM